MTDRGAPSADPAVRWMHGLFDSSPEAVAAASSLELCYANAAFAALLGYPDRDELIGKHTLDLVAPCSRDLVMEIVRRRSMGEAAPPAYVVRCVRRDGSEIDVEVRSGSSLVEGRRYGWGVHRPLEARGQEDALPQLGSAAFYRAIFDVNTAMKLLIDPTTGRILDANRAAVRFYGWSLEQLRGMRISDINTLTDDEVQQEMQRARTRKRGYFRFRHRIASGAVRHVEVHSGPVQLGDRHLLLSIIHDVTERDALEQQLRSSQRLEAVGRLAGGIAHEFNNLLTVMLNASTMLLRQVPEDSELRPQLEDLSFAAGRAADLTRELLAFSKRQVMQPQSLQLNEIVEEMSGVMQRTLGAAVQIEPRLAAELPPTRVDPRQLEHVLMNLVLNARDAMPAGGRIVIQTSAARINELEARSVPPGDWVRLRVRDEGQGMDEETQSRMFEPFFTTKAPGHGTGLGLATVYGIVTQSGGHLEVTSRLGRGTEIAVYLPVAHDDEPDRAARGEEAGTRIKPATVLLVDDFAPVRTSLAQGLEALGFAVIEAASAEDALALPPAQLSRVDALVSDVVMPGRTGIELAAELLASSPQLPVLLLSGDLRDQDVRRLPPTVGTMQKPVAAEQIAARLAEMLPPSPR